MSVFEYQNRISLFQFSFKILYMYCYASDKFYYSWDFVFVSSLGVPSTFCEGWFDSIGIIPYNKYTIFKSIILYNLYGPQHLTLTSFNFFSGILNVPQIKISKT